MKNFGSLTLIVSSVLGVAVIGYMTFCSIQFERNCEGYLKRAADSNTIELAKQELRRAIDYIESENLTSGSTHIIYSTPASDLGFWYTNLKASLEELESTPPDVDRLVASNQLLKLRESLMDNGEKRTKVTAPRHIGLFPNQVAIQSLAFVSLLGFMAGLVGWAIASGQCESKGKC